jgi:hypothetical protein
MLCSTAGGGAAALAPPHRRLHPALSRRRCPALPERLPRCCSAFRPCPPGSRAGKSGMEPDGARRSHSFVAVCDQKSSSERDSQEPEPGPKQSFGRAPPRAVFLGNNKGGLYRLIYTYIYIYMKKIFTALQGHRSKEK